MGTLFDALIQKILALLQSLWNQIFGAWNYLAIFQWLPSDIRAAATVIITVLFGLAVWRLLMQIIPH